MFLKARDVKNYQDFDRHLKAGTASTVVHLRHNLVGERAYRRKQLIQRKGKILDNKLQVLELTDESESELGTFKPSRPKSSTQARSHQRNHQRKTSPYPLSSSWSPPATILACKRKPSSELEHLKDTRRHCALPRSSPRSPSLGPRYTASSSPGPSIKQEPAEPSVRQSAGSPGTLEDPIILDIDSEEDWDDDDEDTKTWPADFYAVDIVQYFQDHKARQRSVPAAQFFQQCFGLPFRSSTYSDHLARWKVAPQSAKDAILAAQRTPAGLWSVFMRENPAKDATLRRLKRAISVSD